VFKNEWGGPASEDVEYGVDMPSPVRGILLRGNHHVARALLSELCLSRSQELNQVPGIEYSRLTLLHTTLKKIILDTFYRFYPKKAILDVFYR
jgi:hypothetical protein